MKLIKDWKKFTRVQKEAWNKWAKLNRVVLPNGNVDYVSGHKACTLIAANRALFGWNFPTSQTPDGYTPLLPTPFLTNVDCGAYTTGAGSLLLRTLVQLNAEESNFLVWATPPVTADVVNPAPLFRFCKAFAPTDADILANTFLPNFATDYRAKVGSFNGPGIEGLWDTPHFIWFRIHECYGGQLGPATVFRTGIYVDA